MNITSIEALRTLYAPARERSVKKEMPQLDFHCTRFIGLSPFVVVASSGGGGANIPAIGTERDQAAVLAESGSSVVTSILGQASFEIKEVMRLLRDGNISGERLGQIENLPLNGNFSENLQDGVNFLLITLRNGVIKTNVASEKP